MEEDTQQLSTNGSILRREECSQHVSDLNGFVAVGTVVDNGQGLLEARASDPDHISDQLTDSNHHLNRKRKQRIFIFIISKSGINTI